MYREEELIGKKVFILNEKNHFCSTDGKEYTVTEFKSYKEVGDITGHVVAKDEEGNSVEVRDSYVVIAPDKSLPEIDMIHKYLDDNGIYGEIWQDDDYIGVEINWGDWKHDHAWCRNAMEYIGYNEIYETVTEENGTDCYCAVHAFSKAA